MTRRSLAVVDVTEDAAAAESRTVVVAFRCPACQQMLHIEYLVSPFGGGAAEGATAGGAGGADSGEAAREGVGCPRCGERHRLRLPGVVRDVWQAE